MSFAYPKRYKPGGQEVHLDQDLAGGRPGLFVSFTHFFDLLHYNLSRIGMTSQNCDQVTEDDSEPIPLPNVTSGTLAIILTWIDLHQVQSCKSEV